MKKIYIVIFFAFLVFLSNYTWSANYNNPIDGIFKEIYGDTIIVEIAPEVNRSADTDSQNGNLTFYVNSNTGYRNFHRLTQLKRGDHVRVAYKEDFKIRSKQKFASMITKFKN